MDHEEDHEDNKDKGQGYADPGHQYSRPTSNIQNRTRNHMTLEEGKNLTKIILLDGKHIWLNLDTHTDIDQIKKMIQQRQGIDPNAYQLSKAQQKEGGKHQGRQHDQEDSIYHMKSAMLGGTAGKRKKKQEGKVHKEDTVEGNVIKTPPNPLQNSGFTAKPRARPPAPPEPRPHQDCQLHRDSRVCTRRKLHQTLHTANTPRPNQNRGGSLQNGTKTLGRPGWKRKSRRT